MKPVPFPWERALAIGLGVLRLSPEEFWKMTPREFAAALRGLYGEPAMPLDRAALDALMLRFPDERSRILPSLRGAPPRWRAGEAKRDGERPTRVLKSTRAGHSP